MCEINIDKDSNNTTLTVIKGEELYSIKGLKDKSIMENLIDNKIMIWAPCNGRGTCGKCKVKLVQGNVKRERSNHILLTNKEIEEGICLACSSYTLEDCTIKIEQVNDARFEILDSYKNKNLELNSDIKINAVHIDEDELDGLSLTNFINLKSGKNYKYSLKALTKLSTVINESSKEQISKSFYGKKSINLVLEKDKVIDIFNEGETKAFGVAIDIGTTTVVLSLIDLTKGNIVSNVSVLNSQKQFGADVISRIQYSSEKSMKNISNAIREDIIKGIEKVCFDNKIDKSQIYKVAIAGNTVMLHILMGLFCESIAVYPFNSVVDSTVELKFNELFRDSTLECTTIILPSVSAYVGADITAGMVSCDFHKSEDICMLVDIGTNGEMVIGNKNKILSTATAAGPAFEGANIENGVGSVEGAIYSVKIGDSSVTYKTIGEKEPVGICGSAVIDIVSEALKNNLINNTGKINTEICGEKYIKIAENEKENIVFTQKDVRELQLAKSAIRAGIEVLIKNFGCTYKDIDKLYIAGGFGNKMNIDNAVAIGLIPEELKDKVSLVGNTSLGGTVMYLLDQSTESYLRDVLSVTKTIDISLDEEFNNLFIENMSF